MAFCKWLPVSLLFPSEFGCFLICGSLLGGVFSSCSCCSCCLMGVTDVKGGSAVVCVDKEVDFVLGNGFFPFLWPG